MSGGENWAGVRKESLKRARIRVRQSLRGRKQGCFLPSPAPHLISTQVQAWSVYDLR